MACLIVCRCIHWLNGLNIGQPFLLNMVFKIYFRNVILWTCLLITKNRLEGVSFWTNNPKKMNKSTVDATQSCDALLQNLNEDYQERFSGLILWCRLSLCWKQLFKEDGLILLWKVSIRISGKSNSTLFLFFSSLVLSKIFVTRIICNFVIVWIRWSQWDAT